MSGRTHFLCARATLWLSTLLPAAVMAEGAVRVLACEVQQQCDAAGQCESRQQVLEFRMEPKSLNADGSGEFRLQYRDKQMPMRSLSEAGPFVWSDGQDRYTVLASSETQFLLHTLTLDDKPHATIQFMRCSFRQ
jgi:hypothetical protein